MLDFFLDNLYSSNSLLNSDIKELEFSVLDFETTGLYPYNGDRIIEIGVVRMNSTELKSTYDQLVNPRISIPEEVSKINHINNSMVEDKPLIDDKMDEILAFLENSVIVGHNLSFDMSFLNHQLEKLKRPIVDLWLVDTLKVSKMLLPHLDRYSLTSITQHLKIKNKDAHRALADAEATALVFKKLLEQLEPGTTLKDLLAFKMS